MEKRHDRRRARRMQVRFWKLGEADALSGYSHNLSSTGMFIATSTPLPVGQRVRVELVNPRDGFVIEGVVAHAAKVAPALQSLRATGMGVRFLPPEELVERVLAKGGFSQGERPLASASGEKAPPVASGQFEVAFASSAELQRVFDRDIRNGGLFVSTPNPPDIDQTVTIQLQLPGGPRLDFPAQVVQRVAPSDSGGGGIGVAFHDPSAVLAALGAHLSQA